MGVGTADGEAGKDVRRGCLRGVYARGTNPAARILDDTIHLASTAPWECRASWAGESLGFESLRLWDEDALEKDSGTVVDGEDDTELWGEIDGPMSAVECGASLAECEGV